MINEKELEKLAFLARIKLEKKEIAKTAQDLDSILVFVNKMGGVNTDKTEPFFHYPESVNTIRDDEIRSTEKETKEIMKKTGKYEKNYLKIDLVL